jgi:hypothetical protein
MTPLRFALETEGGRKSNQGRIIMKGHLYEYKVLVEYLNPEERGVVPHLALEEDQDSLTRIIGDVFEHLPESIPEGWEVNSHNITFSRNTMIISVLLRRPVAR